ncbi:MAG: zinc-binding dehydrogenase [Burkholderiaceae bacterium]|nr:zinc-binding dehydrogenase [Pseudomonadota bacterium]MBS0596493.1 zinc-binding dehydrogenase [Pseudomonadota bacterium]MCO5116572.1 zinc-binding dehydrogenase [Burkholderiaceae bacterium]MCP5219227.1 zinc-binding dehydrogenase [Burkholderiaceae bacterium]
MFAVYASQAKPDDPQSALVVGERPAPDVPPGHVAVNVRAASLNMHDVWTLRGVGIRAEQFPMILGMDGAGVTDDGREVVIHSVIPSPGWRGDETLDPRRSMLTESYQGTFADRVVVPETNVLPKPAALSFSEAACMGTAWLTAYRMLFVKSGLRPGQTMLVQGASGGVPTALIQLGRAAGLQVWVTGRSEAKRALALELGAQAAFEPGARLPDRVDGVFDSVGRQTWSHSLRALKPGGVLVTCGATTGDATAAELQRVFFLQLRILGSTMGTRSELADLLSFCVQAGIHPRIGAELPMAEAAKAFRLMMDGETGGKVVLTR